MLKKLKTLCTVDVYSRNIESKFKKIQAGKPCNKVVNPASKLKILKSKLENLK